MADFTQFQGVIAFGECQVTDQLKTNLVEWCDWSFLQVGAFFNVCFPSPATQLNPVSDPSYPSGCVWEGFRKNWVWETGVPLVSVQPIGISGVWVNNAFRPYGSGYHIDYPNGRVIFNNPVSSTGTVAAEYAFRRVNVDTSDAEWFKELQFQTIEALTAPTPRPSGLTAGAVQLPALVIDAVDRVKLTPFQLGSTTQVHQQDIIFHVISETEWERTQLRDIVIRQKDHRIQLFDKNVVEASGVWPLDEFGTPCSGVIQYPTLSTNYRWRTASFDSVQNEPISSVPPLYRAALRVSVGIDL